MSTQTQDEGLAAVATAGGEIPPVALPNKNLYFGKEVRLGSRKVLLQVVEKPFSILPKGKDAQSIRSEVIKRIGSQWVKGTKDIMRGLTREEESKYMPRLISLKGDQADKWEEKTLEYWANFTVQVPNDGKGLELEIGFHEVRISQFVTEILPINLEHYMMYHYAKQSGNVIDEYNDNILPAHEVRIIDKAKIQDEAETIFTLRKDVDKDFLVIIRSTDQKDRNLIDWILETSGGDVTDKGEGEGMVITGLSAVQKEMELEKIKNRDLVKFKKMIDDPHLELKATIRKGITYNTKLKLEGNTYFYGNISLGYLEDAIGYFANPNNVRERQILDAAVKQATS